MTTHSSTVVARILPEI